MNNDPAALGLLLDDLLGCPIETIVRTISGNTKWREIWDDACTRWYLPIHRAIFAGFLCDRLAWVFASGYQAAIQCLYADLPKGITVAMCISEAGGNHPRNIHTRLTPIDQGYFLDGEKRFVTGGESADRLIVAASIGEQDGRNRLRMAWVDRGTDGVVLSSGRALPFIPELTHCSAVFRKTFIPSNNILPGDGYAATVKPFRTIEDLHVTGAVLGHLLGMARRFEWPGEIVERLSLLIAGVVALAGEDPLSPAIHVALGGLSEQVDALLTALDPLWPMTGEAIHRRWLRDRPVLNIADKVRQQRLNKAWNHYGHGRI